LEYNLSRKNETVAVQGFSSKKRKEEFKQEFDEQSTITLK